MVDFSSTDSWPSDSWPLTKYHINFVAAGKVEWGLKFIISLEPWMSSHIHSMNYILQKVKKSYSLDSYHRYETCWDMLFLFLVCTNFTHVCACNNFMQHKIIPEVHNNAYFSPIQKMLLSMKAHECRSGPSKQQTGMTLALFQIHTIIQYIHITTINYNFMYKIRLSTSQT